MSKWGLKSKMYSDVINERTLSERRSKDEKYTLRLRGELTGVARGIQNHKKVKITRNFLMVKYT